MMQELIYSLHWFGNQGSVMEAIQTRIVPFKAGTHTDLEDECSLSTESSFRSIPISG